MRDGIPGIGKLGDYEFAFWGYEVFGVWVIECCCGMDAAE